MKWAGRIARAEKKGKFNSDDKVDSSNWLTCTVGEKGWGWKIQLECNFKGLSIRECNFKGLSISHVAGTSEAHQLGHRFNYAVLKDRISEAKRIYEQIQKLKP